MSWVIHLLPAPYGASLSKWLSPLPPLSEAWSEYKVVCSPMRTITLIIIHCSATPEGKFLSAEACRQDHIQHRGFRDIGYHFYITRDGGIHRGRSLERIGAHCKNHNRQFCRHLLWRGPVCRRHTRGHTDTGTESDPAGLAPGVAGCPARSNHCRTSGLESAEGLSLFWCGEGVWGVVKTAPYFNYVSTKTNKSTPLSYISCISSSIARYSVVFPDFISTK